MRLGAGSAARPHRLSSAAHFFAALACAERGCVATRLKRMALPYCAAADIAG